MRKIYEEIFWVLDKYQDKIIFDVDHLRGRANLHMFGLELKEKYGLNIDPGEITSRDWQRLGDNIHIGLYDGERRKISWSDDDRQPENELLLNIHFPTGAYIFGEHYPNELFQDFFEELRGYGPKYSDTVNKCLYFSLQDAAKVFNDYPGILKKYKDLDNKEHKKRQIESLKKQLEQLEK